MTRLNFCSLVSLSSLVRLALAGLALAGLALAGLAACDNSNPASMGADAQPPADGNGGVPSPGAGLAVVNSDYVSTSVSLIDPATAKVKKGDCINSGTHTPGNTLALSGDVGLPSQPQPMNLLVTIDHANSALTWIDPSTCTPLRQ